MIINKAHCLVKKVFSRYYISMASTLIYDYVERLSELLRVDSRQAGAEYGLQPVQLEMLHYLSICNRFSDTPMAVTEYLGQTKGTVSQTLKVLEKKGLLVKQPDLADKRIAHLSVTPEGKKLIGSSIPTPMFIKACEGLADEIQADIEGALSHLLTTLLQANNMKSFGVCRTCRYNDRLDDGNHFCSLVQLPLSMEDIQLICREHESVKA